MLLRIQTPFMPGAGRCCAWLAPVLLLSLALSVQVAGATVLDPIGPTYPIREKDLLKQITERLQQMQRSGEIARLQQEAARRNVAAVHNPRPVAGLATGTRTVTIYYDPTFTLERNITDQHGRVLFPAGTRKNPLEVVRMPSRLLFFDGRDPRQLTHARRLVMQYGQGVKPVLVGGPYLELMRKWKIPLYFDQGGALVRQFGIVQVPALVYQEGMRLRIDQLGLAP